MTDLPAIAPPPNIPVLRVERVGDVSLIKVRPSTYAKGLGAMLHQTISEDNRVTLRAIGASATNQALKGAIIARQNLAAEGYDLVIRPGFTYVPGRDGKPVTAVVLHCLLA